MKYFYIVLLSIIVPFCSNAQTTTNFTEFPLPQFSILLTDSTTLYKKTDLPKGKKVIIMLFSPDCDHCKAETETIKKNIKQFKNTHIVMVTSQPFSKMKDFYKKYELANYNGITVGQDTRFFFPSYFKVKFLPYMAIYDKKYTYMKHFEGNAKWEELQTYIK